MAELMGDHARHLVNIAGLFDQPLEHIDMAAGQGDRIGFFAPDYRRPNRQFTAPPRSDSWP